MSCPRWKRRNFENRPHSPPYQLDQDGNAIIYAKISTAAHSAQMPVPGIQGIEIIKSETISKRSLLRKFYLGFNLSKAQGKANPE